ncbi:MAG TPA: hypothetical protein VGM50_21885 [Gemmatimonadaceae bacterium]
MSHLPTERLAALVDEAPSAEEALHLAACAECMRERATLQSLADLAMNESARIGSPITSWDSLRPALIADGVIDSGRGPQFRARRVPQPWLQAAAAVLLIAGGVMAGRYTAGASLVPNRNVANTASRPVASATTADSVPIFRSIDDALAAQERSQVVYQSATAFLAQRDTSARGAESAASMRTRLTALDQANQVMGAALTEAPYDPVINGYYLTTLGQREATLRQINTTMPASMRVSSY